MDNKFSLSQYLSNGIENVIKGVVKASLRNPRETAFMLKFALAVKEAEKKREALEKLGEKVPAFLISSITTRCNLFCTGCYARANKSCGEVLGREQLSAQRWAGIFSEARELGISFILLAGGEPLMRKDIIGKAAEVRDIMFPVFTNGTLLQDEYIQLFN
jgi:MoaA/NifB/PqqE/SkfB family radical SAM enzyme